MLEVRPLAFVSAEPGEDICRTAEAKQASLILLGAHKPLLLEGRLSGTVGDVVAAAHCPVGVLVDRGLKRISRVLVAFAGGPADLAALELARRIARTPGTSLTLFRVVTPSDFDPPEKAPDQTAEALQGLADIRAQAPGDAKIAVLVRSVEHSSLPDAVLEECRRGYDLVVLGMHPRWGLGAGVIGLRRQRVLAEATVSILAVHPPLGAADAVPAPEPHASGLPSSTMA
jgi:nucleotide-binding universal stress UspA family protein